MYIMVKQLSKAMPTKKRHTQNDQKELQNAVAIPAANPTKLVPTKAETRPCLSANQPNTKPPSIAPPKKIAWAIVGRAELSHTQFCLKKKNQMVSHLIVTTHVEIISEKRETLKIRIQSRIQGSVKFFVVDDLFLKIYTGWFTR